MKSKTLGLALLMTMFAGFAIANDDVVPTQAVESTDADTATTTEAEELTVLASTNPDARDILASMAEFDARFNAKKAERLARFRAENDGYALMSDPPCDTVRHDNWTSTDAAPKDAGLWTAYGPDGEIKFTDYDDPAKWPDALTMIVFAIELQDSTETETETEEATG